VPIGGGGLIAGISAYIKAVNPSIKVIGVETEDANAMYLSLKQDKRVALEKVGLFADGTAVKQVGEKTFEVCRHFVDEVILVTTDELCASIKDIFEDTRAIVEPSGALGVAGLKKYVERGSGSEDDQLVAINSGANMNFDRLRYVSERAQIGEKREAVIAVTIPESPGSFKKLRKLIGYDRNVTEFNYRYADESKAHVYCAFEILNLSEVENLVKNLNEEGFKTLDLT
jgi:threonine dehydratase